ncbi:MAG: hypothetical protein ACFBSC_04350 [Microcoleaceae cyanobacterium]
MLEKNWSALTQWAESVVRLAGVQFQARLRGHDLHLICEADPCPPEKLTVSRLFRGLEQTQLQTLIPPESIEIHSKIQKIFLCGRTQGGKRPEWTVRLGYDSTTAQPSLPTEFKLTSDWDAPEPAIPPSEVELPVIHQAEPEVQPIQHPRVSPTEIDSPGVRSPSIQPPGFQSLEIQAQEKVDSHATPAPSVDAATPVSPVQSSAFFDLSPAVLSSTSQPSASPITPTELEPPVSDLSSEAIAQRLSQLLGGLGVTVRVGIREAGKPTRKLDPETQASEQPKPTQSPRLRLWVVCESAYSPDPSLLAEPIAQHLRELKLDHLYKKRVRDAYILSQVRGEVKPDWMLRVDLTPPNQILKDWARWGDAEAIAYLVNQKLAPMNWEVRTTLQESTLHLFCQVKNTQINPQQSNPQATSYLVPSQSQIRELATPLLEAIAPQGIHAAALYGLEQPTPDINRPAWIDWLNLPAAVRSDLYPSPLILAQQGNLGAIKFLLNRLLNPDLGNKLATGGIRVLLLQKQNVLHVMAEAPTCPSQSQIVPQIVKAFRHQAIAKVMGMRIYGRRAGQKYPLWRYGFTLNPSPAVQQPATDVALATVPPTNAIANTAGKLTLPADFVPEELEAGDVFSEEAGSEPTWQRSLEKLSQVIQQGLVASRLFVSRDSGQDTALVPTSTVNRSWPRKTGLILVWGTLGGLLAVQADLILGQFLHSLSGKVERAKAQSNSTPDSEVQVVSNPSAVASPWQALFSRSKTQDNPSQPDESGAFQSSEFVNVPGSTPLVYPSFTSQQLDEQLARYQQYIAREKHPPDILIVGSSRALRGIDPDVLQQSLAAQGHPGLGVFNFGVNGATLQVVDLILSRILLPEQLPKLVIIADGVRAMNGGRADRTYDTIAASEGYQQLAQGQFRIWSNTDTVDNSPSSESDPNLSQPIFDAATWEKHLDQTLGQVSAVYSQRDLLKGVMQETFRQQISAPESETVEPEVLDESLVSEASRLQSNGFLPLSIQFDPAVYYENHSKVSGYYDRDYQSFELEGIQMDALKRLVDYTQDHRVELVFVNMPLTRDYLDEVRMAYEEKFRREMERLELQMDLIFVDLAFDWIDTYNYFSDPSHLNQYGAEAVAQRLAQDNLITWPNP